MYQSIMSLHQCINEDRDRQARMTERRRKRRRRRRSEEVLD
jgi:hypothetical protein